ncbi:hypothetical protein FGO68_gene10184 [Halteria grandinella]|uniref:Uncharacterized protein n=1 Tax=Halteria grandinella TaxID=5974 RepID=A0A8J8NPF2_HALGN|nr:hypothetical protein FGO68_gene10184 [Halteria grandinella]
MNEQIIKLIGLFNKYFSLQLIRVFQLFLLIIRVKMLFSEIISNLPHSNCCIHHTVLLVFRNFDIYQLQRQQCNIIQNLIILQINTIDIQQRHFKCSSPQLTFLISSVHMMYSSQYSIKDNCEQKFCIMIYQSASKQGIRYEFNSKIIYSCLNLLIELPSHFY